MRPRVSQPKHLRPPRPSCYAGALALKGQVMQPCAEAEREGVCVCLYGGGFRTGWCGWCVELLCGCCELGLFFIDFGVPRYFFSNVFGMAYHDGRASITQLNTVRKHLSAIKGGQLGAAAHPARLVALILSDVVGDEVDVIASGPTVPDPSTYADALAALDALAVAGIPPRVLHRLQVLCYPPPFCELT